MTGVIAFGQQPLEGCCRKVEFCMDQVSNVCRVPHWLRLAIIAVGLALCGCANMNHTGNGAVMGTAIGSVAGAMIGGESGHAAGGAVIGALTGATAGGLIGNAEDARIERDVAMAQRDGAIAQAQYIAQQQQQQRLTNFDLIRLTQSGVSDEVIVNMIRARGGQFDLTTDSIIALKSNGVSDRVIVAAQSAPVIVPAGAAMTAPAAPAPGVVVVPPPPPAVIVEPGPPAYWGWGYHRHYGHGPYRHRPGSRVDLFFGF